MTGAVRFYQPKNVFDTNLQAQSEVNAWVHEQSQTHEPSLDASPKCAQGLYDDKLKVG